MLTTNFDIIVVGAGHAGVEACLATSRLNQSTLLITSNKSRIAYMSCNPSIGGLAKGHMVREIDVLGGEMGSLADQTCIQFKRLNASRGPAVRGTRVQNDKEKYSRLATSMISNQNNLSLLEAEVKQLILKGHKCIGVELADGSRIFSGAVIITTGTFMNAVMHTGLKQEAGGRVGDKATSGLSNQLAERGFSVKRLKTGTPARLISESIDWSKTAPQFGDEKLYPFSVRSPKTSALPQVACYLSRTTEETHDIIRKNLHLSPMYCGMIEGVGPRYCPSIEDKVVRFADRTSHQTFLEPESLETNLIYLQGISTSLPTEAQDQFLRTIPGLEHVSVARYGYAVEYDFIEPTQILHRLEARNIQSLFLAGQINGTSGYEEAAAQGFLAGVNAAHSLLGKEELVLSRDEAYMGVMVDDLVTKGTREPYRMFTSRAEHRLLLREDNTIDRLISRSASLGITPPSRLQMMTERQGLRDSFLEKLKQKKAFPNEETQRKLIENGSTPLLKSVSLEELLRRPELTPQSLFKMGLIEYVDNDVYEPVEILVKYSGYIQRQQVIVSQMKELENKRLPLSLDYSLIKGLSSEERQKLSDIKPRTLGQAQRISGVNPSAIQAIMIFLKGSSIKEIIREPCVRDRECALES
jgi:tRNA uridine 5-carboxymethylaminomethyl modification enzyme